MTTHARRPSLFLTIAGRVIEFPRRIRQNLGTNHKYRCASAIGYTLGATGVLYSVFSLLYDYNIDLRAILRLPLLVFFREQLLPFLASPLIYFGINIGRLGSVLLTASLIGGSILAQAEFRTCFRWLKHVFVKRERGPRFDPKAFLQNPGLPEPPAHSLMSRLTMYGLAALLGYSFIGLIAFSVFVPVGLYFFVRDVRYILTWFASHFLYMAEHLLAPYERWGDDQYWGTRWFLAVFTRRRELDSVVERYYVDFWRIDSLDPKKRTWVAGKNSVRDGARVVALSMWFFLLVLAVSGAVVA